jgi:hypothetical protein
VTGVMATPLRPVPCASERKGEEEDGGQTKVAVTTAE